MQVFDESDFEAVKQVLKTGELCSVKGEVTGKFENAFAHKIGATYAVAMNSGMSALHAAVAAADAGPGDEVVCDPMVQFGAMAVIYNNAVPVFADINPDTYLINPDSFQSRITERTKAVICTHLWGLPCDMHQIMAIAKRHDIIVIEDCAHALFAQYKSRFTGTLGHIGIFSFQMSKQLGLGDGGMATTSDPLLHDRLIDGAGTRGFATFPRLMWNYRMNELVSAIGLSQLEKAHDYVEKHRERAKIYNDAVAGVPWIKIQNFPEDRTHSYHFWAARLLMEEFGLDKMRFEDLVRKKGVELRIGYIQKPAYRHDVFTGPLAYGRGCPFSCHFYASSLKYQPGICPEAEKLMPNLLLIPLKWKTEENHKRNAERLREAIEKSNK
ncbi:MAG: DegT/DnrJ/EryC1/StrS family aminotransferase [Candidatus Hodarchaeota archaeon]